MIPYIGSMMLIYVTGTLEFVRFQQTRKPKATGAKNEAYLLDKNQKDPNFLAIHKSTIHRRMAGLRQLQQSKLG